MSWAVRLALIAGAAAAWFLGAAQVAHHNARLPATSVVPGAVITQPFGCTSVTLEPFDPLCPYKHVHTGVDLAARAGTAVRAATGGVARVGYDSAGAGLYVAVDAGGGVRVLYCHLFTAVVRNGQAVSAGDAIGTVGSSGLSTGPHLHLEVQLDGRSVDPVRWLAGDAP